MIRTTIIISSSRSSCRLCHLYGQQAAGNGQVGRCWQAGWQVGGPAGRQASKQASRAVIVASATATMEDAFAVVRVAVAAATAIATVAAIVIATAAAVVVPAVITDREGQ